MGVLHIRHGDEYDNTLIWTAPLRSNLDAAAAGGDQLLHSNAVLSTCSVPPARSWGTSEDVMMWAGSPTWVSVSR